MGEWKRIWLLGVPDTLMSWKLILPWIAGIITIPVLRDLLKMFFSSRKGKRAKAAEGRKIAIEAAILRHPALFFTVDDLIKAGVITEEERDGAELFCSSRLHRVPYMSNVPA